MQLTCDGRCAELCACWRRVCVSLGTVAVMASAAAALSPPSSTPPSLLCCGHTPCMGYTAGAAHRAPPAPAGRPDLEFGDKVILPQDAFREISALKLPYPLTFEIQNERRKAAGVADKHGVTAARPKQFCGVLEFSAPAEQAYLPFWMMQNLLLREGGRVVLKSVPKVRVQVCGTSHQCTLSERLCLYLCCAQIPKGTFLKLEPQDEEFLDIVASLGPKVGAGCCGRRRVCVSTQLTRAVHPRRSCWKPQ